jgi:protein ImuB
MFAVICLPDFELQSVLRYEPELRSQAIALVDGETTNAAKTLVLQCTEKARAAGVCARLTAPQAQARCGELILKPRSPSAERSTIEILLQTAYAFSPNIEHTAPGVCTIDLRGLNFSKERPASNESSADILSAVSPTSSRQSADSAGALESNDAPQVENLRYGRLEVCATNPEVAQQQSFEFFRKADSPAPSPWGEGDNMLLAEWSQKITTALQQLNLRAQLGIAATPNIALLAARAAKPVLVVDRVEAFFQSLPLTALEPPAHLFSILQRWGIHTAGAFLALGQDAIADRLGAEALELFERASTHTIRPLNIVLPADTFEERTEFEVQIETIEPLLFVLRRFIDQLATRIALTYRVVAELQLTLTLESGALYERTFKVPAPTANVETLFRMLHTHLESLRTDAPIASLQLSATPTRAEAQQFGLFESALRDPNHFHETLARLTALLGTERVGMPIIQPSHHPDVFRMQTPAFGNGPIEIRNSKSETRNSLGLCLRRFRPPILAEVELKDGRPVFISSLKVSGKVVKTPRGPWCTSGGWWDQRRWMRQEWDVETSEGTVYRLFYAKGNWSIEGIYD